MRVIYLVLIGLFSLNSFADLDPVFNVDPQIQARLQRSPAGTVALDAVKSDYKTLLQAGKVAPVANITDVGFFGFPSGLYVSITLKAPQTLHWVVQTKMNAGSCEALLTSMDIFDDERGGGGISVHN